MELLVRHGADFNVQDEEGLTALQRAGIGAHKDIEELFVQHGADPNTRLILARESEAGRRVQAELEREIEGLESELEKKLAKTEKKAERKSFWLRFFG